MSMMHPIEQANSFFFCQNNLTNYYCSVKSCGVVFCKSCVIYLPQDSMKTTIDLMKHTLLTSNHECLVKTKIDISKF